MRYNLQELTEFPHPLIYSFSPESSSERLINSSDSVRTGLYYESMQHLDMLNAYLYAQNSVLQKIRDIGLSAISAEQWLVFIKEIHLRMGNTILGGSVQSSAEEVAGICRWHAGITICAKIERYLTTKNTQAAKQFINELHRQYQYSVADLSGFIKVAKRILSISAAYCMETGLMPAGDEGSCLTHAVIHAFEHELLSESEKTLVSKFAKVTRPQAEIPGLMQEYAARVVANLQTLDTRNTLDVARFLASTFYELTDIHPYPNCNGRTATCLINVLLVAMGHPAIILRLPGERQDLNSRYTTVMNVIDKTLEPFIELIHERMELSKSNPRYADDISLRDLVEQRVLMSIAYAQMWQRFPEFNADTFQQEALAAYEAVFIEKDIRKLPMAIMFNIEAVQVAKTILAFKYMRRTLEAHREMLINKLSGAATKYSLNTLSKSEQDDVIQAFICLTGEESGWKAYKQGTTILFRVSDKQKVNVVCQKLNNLAVCRAEVKKVKKQVQDSLEEFVVQITDVNHAELKRHANADNESLLAGKMRQLSV